MAEVAGDARRSDPVSRARLYALVQALVNDFERFEPSLEGGHFERSTEGAAKSRLPSPVEGAAPGRGAQLCARSAVVRDDALRYRG